MRELLEGAAERAIRYLVRIDEMRVFPDPKAIGRLSKLDISLPDRGVDPKKVLETLDQIGRRLL